MSLIPVNYFNVFHEPPSYLEELLKTHPLEKSNIIWWGAGMLEAHRPDLLEVLLKHPLYRDALLDALQNLVIHCVRKGWKKGLEGILEMPQSVVDLSSIQITPEDLLNEVACYEKPSEGSQITECVHLFLKNIPCAQDPVWQEEWLPKYLSQTSSWEPELPQARMKAALEVYGPSKVGMACLSPPALLELFVEHVGVTEASSFLSQLLNPHLLALQAAAQETREVHSSSIISKVLMEKSITLPSSPSLPKKM